MGVANMIPEWAKNLLHIGSGRPPFQPITFKALAAGSKPRQYRSLISTIQIFSASVNSSEIEISFDGADYFNLPIGVKISGFYAPYGFYIRNTDPTFTQDVIVHCGQAQIDDQRIIIDNVAPGVLIPVVGGLGYTTLKPSQLTAPIGLFAAAPAIGTYTILSAVANLFGAWILDCRLAAGAAGEAHLLCRDAASANGSEVMFHLGAMGAFADLRAPYFVQPGLGIEISIINAAGVGYSIAGTKLLS